jgi:hypothetical protein
MTYSDTPKSETFVLKSSKLGNHLSDSIAEYETVYAVRPEIEIPGLTYYPKSDTARDVEFTFTSIAVASPSTSGATSSWAGSERIML